MPLGKEAANSVYGHGSEIRYRPSTVPLNGTSKRHDSRPSSIRREYRPTYGQEHLLDGGRQRPSSAVVRNSRGNTTSYYQNLKPTAKCCSCVTEPQKYQRLLWQSITHTAAITKYCKCN